MVSKATREELLRLTAAERIQVAQDLWDSVTEAPDALLLTDAQRAVLDERLAAYKTDPQAGSPWETVRERVRRPDQA